MRISDWSSDVCSSDLAPGAGDPAALQAPRAHHYQGFAGAARSRSAGAVGRAAAGQRFGQPDHAGRRAETDRKSVVSGKSVSVRVDIGGRRIIKKKTNRLSQKRKSSNEIKNDTT